MIKLTKIILEFLHESNKIEDVHDAEALLDSVDAWMFLMDKDAVNPSDVAQAHGILMRSRDLPRKYVGSFRDCPVWVGGRACPNAVKVPEMVMEWTERWCQGTRPKDKGEIRKAHVEFEKIHPFADGNGRTGRLLFLWHMVKVLDWVQLIPDVTKFEDYYPWFRE